MVYYKDIEFIEKEDSVEAFCVREVGGSHWKYERKGHQILGRDRASPLKYIRLRTYSTMIYDDHKL